MTQDPSDSDPTPGPDLPGIQRPDEMNQSDQQVSPQQHGSGPVYGQNINSAPSQYSGPTRQIHMGPQMEEDMMGPPKRGMATTSMILGICSTVLGFLPLGFCSCCFFLEAIPFIGGVAAIILGMMFLNAPENIADLAGRKTAKAGVITGIIGAATAGLWALVSIAMMILSMVTSPANTAAPAGPLVAPNNPNPPMVIPATQPTD